MHVFGLSLDLNLFLQFIFTAFVATFGLFHIVKNTASKYFEFDSGGEYRGIMSEDAICIVCGQPGSKKCSRCKAVRYCSQACQVKDWSGGHKNKCKNSSGKLSSTQNGSSNGGFKVSSVGRKPGGIALVPLSGGDLKVTKQIKKILFPYDEFIKLFNWDKPGFPPCGLINCGNSCFANVVLQCLSFTRPLVAYLLERGHRRDCKRNDWCFLCEFQLHLERASRSPLPFSPINILSRLPNIGGNLGYGRQEDAHEFMRFAIDTMQSVCLDEYGGEKAVHPSSQETTLIQHIFGGQLQSQVICTKCGRISNQYENMMDLTVEIHGDASSLEECLNQFTAKEWLHGENMYKCEGCSDYVKAWKRLTVQKAPNILTIALKRFQSGRFGKLNKRVTFPETLDLSPYMSEAGDGTDVYKLYAVVVHLDMLNASFFGHYICYAKDYRGNWFRIDDCKVTSVDLEEVLSQGAYMLLYSRVSARPSCLKAIEHAEEVGPDKELVKIEPCLKEQAQSSDVTVPLSPVSNSQALSSDSRSKVSGYETVLPNINNSERNGQLSCNNSSLEISLVPENSGHEMDSSIDFNAKAIREVSEDMDVDATKPISPTQEEISRYEKESSGPCNSAESGTGSITQVLLSRGTCKEDGLEVARGNSRDEEMVNSNISSAAVKVYGNGDATGECIDLPLKKAQNLISNSFCPSTHKSAKNQLKDELLHLCNVENGNGLKKEIRNGSP